MLGRSAVDADLKRSVGLWIKQVKSAVAAGGDLAEKKFMECCWCLWKAMERSCRALCGSSIQRPAGEITGHPFPADANDRLCCAGNRSKTRLGHLWRTASSPDVSVVSGILQRACTHLSGTKMRPCHERCGRQTACCQCRFWACFTSKRSNLNLRQGQGSVCALQRQRAIKDANG